MKVNELMIGDWVYNSVADIAFQVYPQFFSQWHNRPEQFEVTIQPIPLTPEILEKNGFKNEGYFGKLDIEDFHVLCDTKNVAIFHNEHTDVDIPIMYVHELQHALRLCGIEKEIEL